MDAEQLEFRERVLFSMNGALLDMVTPGLRMVLVRPEYPSIAARFIYDHEPNGDEREDVSVAETEVMCDFGNELSLYINGQFTDGVRVCFDAVCVPLPEKVEYFSGEVFIYARSEKDDSSLMLDIASRKLEIDTDRLEIHGRVLFSFQKALLGRIPPSLRAVLVIPERPQIVARFIFDDSPGIEEYKTVAMVESEVRADFADVRNIHARHIHKSTDEIGVSFTTVNISAPKKIDYLPGEINAYARKESNS